MNASAKSRNPATFRALVGLIAGMVWLWISAGGISWAGASGPAEFRSYPLRNAQPAAVEAALIGLLPPGSEVVADSRMNRVLVGGSAQAHQIAQAAISHLDQPETHPTAQSPAPSAEPVLKVYRCPPGQAAAMATQLEREFGGTPGVRVVPYERASQVLVIAPPGIHTQIEGRGGFTQAASAAKGHSSSIRSASVPVPSSTSPHMTHSRSQQVQLRHSSGQRLEKMLVGMLGDRISPVKALTRDVGAYRLALTSGGALGLSVDRKAHRVTIEGTGAAVESCVQLIHTLDSSRQSVNDTTCLVSLGAARPADVQRAVEAIRSGNVSRQQLSRDGRIPPPGRGSLVTMLYQQRGQTPPDQTEAIATDTEQSAAPAAGGQVAADAEGGAGLQAPPADAQPAEEAEEAAGLVGPVQIQVLEGLDTLLIRGRIRDVRQVVEMIDQIEQIAGITQPAIEVYYLQHVNCEALAELVTQLYSDVFALRQGAVSITALVKPNALLLIGRPESVQTVLDLVKRLDQPVTPETEFRVFRLQHASADTAQEMIEGFFEERGGLGTRVRVTADARSNSLIVQASPRDLLEVAEIIGRIDTPTSEAVNELRLFKLVNSLADELAQILQDAISGAAGEEEEQRSTMLRFITIDTQGQRQWSSGILTDVQITPDARANTLLVSAPAESMPLIEALIAQLDQLPAAEAQIKVFTIVNSDAASLVEMLESLFGEPPAPGEPAIRTAAVEAESTLVPLRFAVDVRTNSIIATGTLGDLNVVEAILLRLDETEVRKRRVTVYRLKNAPAPDVANAINQYLNSERQVVQITTELMSPFQQVEQEVVIVAEPVSNSLIVSATPQYFEEIKQLVEELDERPPMVMIQVLIAEVQLNDVDEFGVELGLQDSILFDRSLLSDLVTTTTTTQTSTPAGIVTVTQELIQAATNTPGFLFNNQQVGNSGSDKSLGTARRVGAQGLSHFDIGRTNSELGYGGLVLSASSEAVSILIRALKESRRLEVLSRPQVMTMDNQPALIQVGERVPRITSATISEIGQINQVTMEDVGLILGVTPRISPDGLVVMEIDATKSEVGPEDEGIPVTISATGEIVRSPRVKNTTAQTTISAVSGQTVILGGLITKSTSETHRRVPLVADVPVVGNLFRYDLEQVERKELLIIMTPHIVENDEDIEAIKQAEAARMHWCLSDVVELQGDIGFRGRRDEWYDSETTVIYPDLEPGVEAVPIPEETPEKVPDGDESPFSLEPLPRQPGQQGATSVPDPGWPGSSQASPRNRQDCGLTSFDHSHPAVYESGPSRPTARNLGSLEANPLRNQQPR